jgi:hypothetical protein
MEHQTSKHHQMQSGDGGRKPLVVAYQASETGGPGKRAFNNPATLPPEVVFCL